MVQNMMQQLLELYDKNMPSLAVGARPPSQWSSSYADSQLRAGEAFNNAGRRLTWAENMFKQYAPLMMAEQQKRERSPVDELGIDGGRGILDMLAKLGGR